MSRNFDWLRPYEIIPLKDSWLFRIVIKEGHGYSSTQPSFSRYPKAWRLVSLMGVGFPRIGRGRRLYNDRDTAVEKDLSSFMGYETERVIPHSVHIRVPVVPVLGSKTPENRRETWHGRKEVILQWLKLLYYRVAIV